MSRPTDWHVLDLSDDPTPGSPYDIRSLVRRVQQVSDDAGVAERDVRGLAGDDAVMSWIGLAADVFQGAIDDFPSQLQKLADSYGRCADALTTYATALEGAQEQADRALVQGREAQADVTSLESQLASARSTAGTAGSAATALSRPPAAGAEPPDPARVRAATRNAQAANDRVSGLSGSLGGAEGRLEAAKRLARDAGELRDTAGDRASDALHDASEAGIQPNSWWDDFKSGVARVWDVTITIAKIAVAVLGIVVLIIGGPLAWVVVGLSLLILADALMKVANGEGGWLDVAIAALGLIPGTKGLTTLTKLSAAFRSGGTLGALAHLGGAGRTLITSGAQGARALWQGRRALPIMARQLPFTAAARLADSAGELRHGLPGAARAFRTGMGTEGSLFGRARTGIAAMGDGFADARNAFTSTRTATDPAAAARAWQGGGNRYPGVDLWRGGTLPSGTPLEGLYPGTSGFVFPGGTMDDLGRDASRISEAAQVGPSVPDGERILNPYRDMGVRFEVVNDVPSATSTVRANPQYGEGGATQHFIPNFGEQVHSGNIIAVDAAGNQVPSFIDQGGSVFVQDVPGGTIPLTGVDVRPGIWDPGDFGAAHDSVTGALPDVRQAIRIPAGLVTKPVAAAGAISQATD